MIYTFYSFKGGVGRSMAMANVAYELAGRGLRVLAIDFDLEAPGLERYFKVPVPSVHATRGVIDLIDAYKKALAGSGSIDDSAEFRQLREHYIHPIAEFGSRGRLDLLPAGRRLSADDRRAYSLAVRTFDWQDFYFNWEGEAFFEWLRRTLSGHADRPGLYDVVLADSRTGVTEMGGVCACQLADVVVMLSAPNYQNIEGTRELARDLDSPAVRELRRQRELGIVVVPARVEQRAPERLPDFIRRFDEAFSEYLPREFAALGLQFHDLALPYVPDYAFEEQVTDRHGPEGAQLDDAYKRLCDAMLVLSQQASLADARAAAEQALRPAAAPDSPAAPLPAERAYDATQRYAGVDAYLSCGRDERPLVEQLAAELSAPGRDLRSQISEAAAYGSERDLPASTAELLNHAQALVLFAGAAGLSPWQREELKLARSLPRVPRVVQVLLRGAADDAFELAFGSTLRDSPLIDLRGWPDDGRSFTLLVDALRGVRQVTEMPMARADDTPPPFPGAHPYGEGDALAFFGRTAEVESLARQVRAERRIVLRGPSGCGKTSLVRAGLFPALRRSSPGFALSYFDLLQQPVAVAELAASTMPADSLLVIDHAGIGDDAQLQAIGQIWARNDGPRLLLVWRDCPLAGTAAEAARRWKAATEAAGRQREHPVHRECPFGPAASALLAATAAAPGLTLAALDAAALRAAIEAALAGAGRRAETGLLDRLFGDAGPQPATAVVQRVLLRLWTLQVRGFLTNEAYGHEGGIDAGFVAAIEACRSDREAEPDAIQALLLRLLRVADDGSLQRRGLSWCREGSQPALTVSSVERLARAGLVTVTRSGPDVMLQLAHLPRSEAWPQAKALHAADTVAPDMLRIADAYARWIDGGDSDEVDSVLDRTPFSALAPRMSFGEACFVHNERRRLKRQRYLQLALGAVMLALIVGGVVFSNEQRQVAASAESAASAAGIAQRELAVAAARATETLALQAPYDDQKASPRPAAAGRTRAVLRISGVAGETDGGPAQAMAQLLSAQGFAVEEEIEIVQQQLCGDVRFHQPQDRAAAEQALQIVNGWLATEKRDPRRLQLNDRSQTRAALPSTAGTIEIWLPPFTARRQQITDEHGTWQQVPAGCAVLGSDQQSRDALRKGLNAPDAAHYAAELPLERRWLAEFYILRTEVTMAQFDRYQKACPALRGKPCPPWQPRYVDPNSEPDRPAVFVSWEQARDYCTWAGGRLPTDPEWEKAARGPEGRFWAWGDKPDDSKFQGLAQRQRRPVAVGSFPSGDSPYGVTDMAGNVWEFTASPWSERDSAYTIRGGSYLNSLMESRASVRWATNSQASGAEFLGFRCVRDSMR